VLDLLEALEVGMDRAHGRRDLLFRGLERRGGLLHGSARSLLRLGPRDHPGEQGQQKGQDHQPGEDYHHPDDGHLHTLPEDRVRGLPRGGQKDQPGRHRGMFPCFLEGMKRLLPDSISSALTTLNLVEDGTITSST